MSKPAKRKTSMRPRAIRARGAIAARAEAVVLASAAVSRSPLPRLFAPVIRDVRRDRIDPHRLAASGNCQSCFDGCAKLPVSLQPICRNLCHAVCTV